jgi:excisionase family DNA binding protein
MPDKPDAAQIDCRTIPVWPDAGRLAGLGRDATYSAVRRGQIPVLRFGRKLRVPVAALERLLEGEVPVITATPAPPRPRSRRANVGPLL